jgi:hypothetical protein
LVGVTDFTLQVADELEMVLKGVRVSRPRQDTAYTFLLGADVLREQGGLLAAATITTGRDIEWHDRTRHVKVVIPVVNPYAAPVPVPVPALLPGLNVTITYPPPPPPGKPKVRFDLHHVDEKEAKEAVPREPSPSTEKVTDSGGSTPSEEKRGFRSFL